MSVVLKSIKSIFSKKKFYTEKDLVLGWMGATLCLVFLITVPFINYTQPPLSAEGAGSRMEPSIEGVLGILCLLAGFWGRNRIKGATLHVRRFSKPRARDIIELCAALIRARHIFLLINVILLIVSVLHRPEYMGPDLIDYSVAPRGSIAPLFYIVSLFVLLFIDDLALLLIGSGHVPAVEGGRYTGLLGAAGSYAITALAVSLVATLFFLESVSATVMIFTALVPILSIGRHVIISNLICREADTSYLIEAARISVVVSLTAFTVAAISLVIVAMPFLFGDVKIAQMAFFYALVVLVVSEAQGQIFRQIQKSSIRVALI